MRFYQELVLTCPILNPLLKEEDEDEDEVVPGVVDAEEAEAAAVLLLWAVVDSPVFCPRELSSIEKELRENLSSSPSELMLLLSI